jgi:PAS domain S-box-containing protein
MTGVTRGRGVTRTLVLRYALAPACVMVVALVQLSPVGSLFPAAGLFCFAVLGAAWFGGAGPGFLTAVLGALTLPQLVAVSYPLLGGFLDLPRFIVFSVMAFAVGWGSSRRAVKLREQERYARAMEASDDGFWEWNPATDAYYVSRRLLEIYGFAPGTTFSGRDDLVRSIPFHPEDRLQMERAIVEHFAGNRARLDIQMRFMRDGETRWAHLAAVAVRHSSGAVVRWTGTVRDITESKRAELALRQSEDALRESEERYELAMAASESGYWDWDIRTDRYVFSPRAYVMGGYDAGTVANREAFQARSNMHPEDLARWEAAREKLFAGTGERLGMEVRYIVHGETRWHSLQAICRRDDAGNVVRWTGSTTDITERKVAEAAMMTMERKLRQAQRLEAMGTLAGGIAHDFNNILGAIFGYGEMALRDAPAGTRLRRDLEAILTAGERGRALVDRVLTFSRSGVGERVPVHVEKVVIEALDLLRPRTPAGILTEARLDACSAAILGDPTQVHQLVMNLATNAIQAMPDGGALAVSLELFHGESARPATVGELSAGEYIRLTVTDSGGGIPDEILDRIFDPFFTTKEVGVGTGLGLSLVHGIVMDIGGALDVKSTIGMGSTFTVFLPRAADAVESAGGHASALPNGNGECVLIIDDEEPLVKLAARTLEELGYVPFAYTSATAALAAFRHDPARFDAVITDERMPGMSGSALAREVRSLRDDLPILLMSGYIGGGLMERAREAGADDVLKKPLSARDLATGVARILQK